MATRTVELTEEQAAFIEERVKSGKYTDAKGVVDEGLRLLEELAREEQEKIEWLRQAIAEGEADFERGDYITLRTSEEIDKFFDELFDEVILEEALAKRA